MTIITGLPLRLPGASASTFATEDEASRTLLEALALLDAGLADGAPAVAQSLSAALEEPPPPVAAAAPVAADAVSLPQAAFAEAGFASDMAVEDAPVAEAAAAPTTAGLPVSTFAPTDPLYAIQWHLFAMGNLQKIWDEFTGSGIYVGVYDTGVQYTHHDLDGNYDATRHVVIGGNPIDGANVGTTAIDAHGTAVAGLIAAENNGVGAVGVAFNASITGVNIFDSAALTGAGRYSAFEQAAQFDVMNNSWGYLPGVHFTSVANENSPGSDAAQVLAGYETAVDTGREIEVSPGNLVDFGTVIVQSAGNNARDGSGSSLNSSRLTITVAALRVDGFIEDYSNHGASILLAAPAQSSVTTDLLGTAGMNLLADTLAGSDYTDYMNGTSAAAPIVSGVVALMLDANPLLGWRDVQNILAASSTHTGSAIGGGAGTNENGSWFINKADDWNGGGMHVHSNYGYGKVNAYNAVRMAEVWSLFGAPKTSANEVVVPGTFGGLPQNLVDNGPFTYAPSLGGFDALVAFDHVAVRLNLTHSDWTQLHISIVSPEGTEIVLADGTSGSATTSDLPLDWTFGIEGLRGERINGTWTLKINDVVAGETGTLNGWTMNFYGSAPTTDDVYTFTDEFAAMVALPGGTARRTVNDSDGGNDWINGAAVTTNQYLDLRNGFTSFTGVGAFTLSGTIENAVGGDGNDTVVGNDLANVVLGMRGADQLYGLDGNDTIGTGFGTPGGDTIYGGNGFDYLDYRGAPDGVGVYFDSGIGGLGYRLSPYQQDTHFDMEGVFGSAFGDQMSSARSGVDYWGMDGADTLSGGSGADTLRGGRGDDAYTVTATDVLVEAVGEGNDTVRSAASFVLAAGVEIEWLETNDGFGFAGINLTGNAFGQVIVGNAGVNVLNGGGGRDVIYGNGDNDTITGGNAADYFFGGTGNDLLIGGDGNDLFYGSWSDVLLGEDGNDTVIGGAGADYLDGGAGLRDLLWYFGLLAVQVALDFSLTFTGDAAGDTILNFEDLWGSYAGDTLAGDGNANILTGDEGDDLLLGQAGADTLIGGNGGDTLDGGTGGDSMVGGAGNDRYIMDDAVNDRTIELPGGGHDTVASYASFGLSANIEDVELLGSADIYAYGNDLDNFMLGNAGNNYLDGLDGADTLSGGLGNDYLIGGEGNDSFIGAAGADYMGGQGGSADTVTYANSAGPIIANLFLGTASGGDAAGDTLSSIEVVIGSNFDDQLIGGTANSTLFGGGGNDLFNASSGASTLYGGQGNDLYILMDQADDQALESPGEGADTVHAISSWTLAPDFEDLWLIGVGAHSGIGNASANRIQGNAEGNFIQGHGAADTLEGNGGDDYLEGGLGNDRLVGGGGNDFLDGAIGADTLEGGTGNDFYLIASAGTVLTEAGGGGIDTVQASSDFTLAADFEVLIHGGSGLRGTGNALDNRIIGSGGADTQQGLDGQDELFSNGGADLLEGGNGNDTLHGGSGAQTLAGGQGNDLYSGVGTGDVLVEVGTGADTVAAEVDWTLAAPFEVLVLVGAALNGTGNGGDNRIIGNALGNLLNGGSGNDTLDGADGADTLQGALGNDSLLGGEGADSLNGTGGADTMAGGNGDDAYVLDSLLDVLSDTGGVDTVFTALAFTLASGFENLTLTGGDAVSGTGNGSANTITGNNAANLLAGGNGNDSLRGEGGADTLSGGAGADTMAGGFGADRYVLDGLTDVVIESFGEGTDTVVIAGSYTLGANVETLQLTGALGFSGTGNALANRIAGNAGANVLAGAEGNDTLVGGDGADTLVGGIGRDVLTGQAGADWFLFLSPTEGLDRLADFTAGLDKVAVQGTTFGGLAPGALAGANFVSHASNAATAAFGTPQFIYNNAAGVLFFDVDGVGGAAGIRLANFTGVPTLATSDFVLF